jgi:hypothetical protein
MYQKSASVAIVILATGGISTTAHAVTDVMAEGVCDYSVEGDAHADFCQDSDGFFTTMHETGSGWTGIHDYQDHNVYDADFLDPDKSGNAGDDDGTLGMDQPGTAISYIALHGVCDDATAQACTTSSQCPVNQACPAAPPNASKSSACVKLSNRWLVTSSTNDIHNHRITYSSGNAKWGEDATTGGWAGAGINGDVNAVFIDNSCGARPPYWWNELQPAFAGTALINIVMPVSNLVTIGTADFIQYSPRGTLLANYALANPNNTPNNGWIYVMNSMPSTWGNGCPNLDGDYSYGGGYGVARMRCADIHCI